MMNRVGIIAVMLLMMMSEMMAQKQLTLEDLLPGGNSHYAFAPAKKTYTWWGDKLVRTDVEECVLVDLKTGKETLLFTLEQINKWAKSDEETFVRHLMNASFPYADKPLVALGNRKSYLLLDFKAKKIVWQDSIAGQTANDWCPASKATAYVEDNQLFVVDGNGKKYQISNDGSREIVYGQSVHRDEFGIRKGTFWSPDGQRLAFYRMDQSMVADYPQVDIFKRMATYEPDKYPMAGETSHKVTVGIFDLKTGKTVYLNAGDPTDRYFTNIAWGPDSKTVYMYELNRDQNDCRLMSYDAQTGEPIAELNRETDEKYVEPQNPVTFLPWDGDSFLHFTQRDGFWHLWLYSKGREVRQITKGPWIVKSIVGFNEKSRSVIILAKKCGSLNMNIFSVNIESGEMKLLDNGKGVHDAILSASGSYLVDMWSAPETPNAYTIINTADGKSVDAFVSPDPWKGYEVPQYKTGTITAADGKTPLNWRMVLPKDFSATEKYPTIVYVYGGPHAHLVDASWHWKARPWETYMAQKGYIIFVLDGRGSEDRGKDFEQVTFRQLGQEEMKDQMKGVDYLRSLPYVDAERLGVHGWSFGGFMTLSLMENYPGVFKAAVAGGPVTDWKWYEVMYGERYMDTPQTNPEGYDKTSIINKVENIKGSLQVIIGYNDNICVPQHSLSFLNACNEKDIYPEFYLYPGELHNMRGHMQVNLYERITRFFERELVK